MLVVLRYVVNVGLTSSRAADDAQQVSQLQLRQ